MTAAKLKELEAKATEGPCVACRIEPTSAADGFYEPYAPYVIGGFPRMVQVDRSFYIHADDMALIAYLRNHCKDFIRLMDAAEVMCGWVSGDDLEAEAKMVEALAAFKEES
jgi:hypothetical protein